MKQSTVEQGEPSQNHHGGLAAEGDLARDLGVMARDLQRQSLDDLLAAIVESAVEIIPGVEGGSISVVLGRKEVSSQAPTSDVPQQLDAIQMQEGEGPCLEVAYEHRTVRLSDMRTERRWPRFAKRAADETGVGSMLCIQLFVEGDNLGALNLYSRNPHAFTDDSEHIGLLVAAHAAVAFAGSRREVQLDEAITSRNTISQAKGILMERYKITSEQAFVLLVGASSKTNAKLFVLAEELVRSGELDDEPR